MRLFALTLKAPGVTNVEMRRIPETGLRRFDNRFRYGLNNRFVGMTEISETGLRPKEVANSIGFQVVEMRQIPETGLRPADPAVHVKRNIDVRRNEGDTGNGIETTDTMWWSCHLVWMVIRLAAEWTPTVSFAQGSPLIAPDELCTTRRDAFAVLPGEHSALGHLVPDLGHDFGHRGSGYLVQVLEEVVQVLFAFSLRLRV